MITSAKGRGLYFYLCLSVQPDELQHWLCYDDSTINTVRIITSAKKKKIKGRLHQPNLSRHFTNRVLTLSASYICT